jgi:hypothetical protein
VFPTPLFYFVSLQLPPIAAQVSEAALQLIKNPYKDTCFFILLQVFMFSKKQSRYLQNR